MSSFHPTHKIDQTNQIDLSTYIGFPLNRQGIGGADLDTIETALAVRVVDRRLAVGLDRDRALRTVGKAEPASIAQVRT